MLQLNRMNKLRAINKTIMTFSVIIMKWTKIIALVFLCAVTAHITTLLGVRTVSIQSIKQSAYERVTKTGIIRCGYAEWPPLLVKDPVNGKLSGVMYDYVSALGEALHLKIEWSEEISWGDFPAALESGRVDAFCAGAWPNASRALRVDFTMPISYQPIYAYARTDDRRFDNNLAAANDESITTVSIDGEMSSLIAHQDFSKAKSVQLPQLASFSELFINIAQKKGDVTFTDPDTAALYNAQNGNAVRRVPTEFPVRVFGDTLSIARGQDEFRRMIDTATVELLYSGRIEAILKQYEKNPGSLLRAMPGYTVSSLNSRP